MRTTPLSTFLVFEILVLSLLHYPTLSESGPENMGTDWWLFSTQEYPDQPKFRYYDWVGDEISFGYGQDYNWVERKTRKSIENLMRRPTGGGIVRHGEDLTYCLVIPKEQKSFHFPSLDLYESIHQSMKDAFSKQGLETELQPCMVAKKRGIPGDCFLEPVGRDLMTCRDGEKIAGAAMKRTKLAVLIQGTIDLSVLPFFNQMIFQTDFIENLALMIGEVPLAVSWPEDFLDQRMKFALEFAQMKWKRERKRN